VYVYVYRLKASGTAASLWQAGKREARPVTVLARHLVNMVTNYDRLRVN
jgi:hypothetical protein